MSGDELTEECIELPRGDTGLPAFERGLESPHDAIRVPSRLSGEVDARRPLDLNELALKLVLNLLLSLLIDEIPLIRDDNEGPSRVDDLLDDAHILLGERG